MPFSVGNLVTLFQKINRLELEDQSSGLGKCLLDGTPEKEAELIDEDGGEEDGKDEDSSGEDEQGQGELTMPT